MKIVTPLKPAIEDKIEIKRVASWKITDPDRVP